MLPAAPKESSGQRGFAGLRSLAATISADDSRPSSEKPPDAAADPPGPPKAAPPEPSPSPQDHGPYQGPPARAPILTPWGKLVFGALALGAVVWAVAEGGSGDPTKPATFAPAALTETRPAIGTEILLSDDQIRYCLSEDIRLEGAKAAVNVHNSIDVDRFNTMIKDYNSRCSSFRYRTGRLEVVRAQVEANRPRLWSAGAALFQR